MKYFLDFDRTVFDTDAFKKSIRRHPTVLELWRQFKAATAEFFAPTGHKVRRQMFFKTWGTFLSHGRFAFTPEELREFLYPDAIAFIATHDCTIVTYGVRAFITAKVTTALTDIKLADTVYTSRKKGRTLRRLTEGANDICVFIDDMPFQLDSVEKWCPHVKVIEMRRNKASGAGRWRVIHSFDDLS